MPVRRPGDVAERGTAEAWVLQLFGDRLREIELAPIRGALDDIRERGRSRPRIPDAAGDVARALRIATLR